MRRSSKAIPLLVTGIAALVIGILIGGFFLPLGSGATDQRVLERGNWADHNYQALTSLIDDHRSDDPTLAKADYAVFDWDNTSIINDVTDKLFLYQADNLRYKLTPDEFAADVASTVPAGPLENAEKNADGKTVTREQIVADLTRDYRFLYSKYKGLDGTESLETVRSTPEFIDFKAKLYFFFEAIMDAHGKDIAYPWETFFFDNMTEKEFNDLASESIRHQMQIGIDEVEFTSPKSVKGKAGQVTVSYLDGMRTVPEIVNLMHTLQDSGIQVYVVSAGFEPLVEAIASVPEFGYNLPKDQVFGLRLQQDEQGRYEPEYLKDWPFTYDKGKPELVRKEISPKHEDKQPVFIAGDSGSDLGNFTEFEKTPMMVLVNYWPTEDMGKIARTAADSMGQADARYYLQGVDENIGLWRPSEETIRFDEPRPLLLAPDDE